MEYAPSMCYSTFYISNQWALLSSSHLWPEYCAPDYQESFSHYFHLHLFLFRSYLSSTQKLPQPLFLVYFETWIQARGVPFNPLQKTKIDIPCEAQLYVSNFSKSLLCSLLCSQVWWQKPDLQAWSCEGVSVWTLWYSVSINIKGDFNLSNQAIDISFWCQQLKAEIISSNLFI